MMPFNFFQALSFTDKIAKCIKSLEAVKPDEVAKAHQLIEELKGYTQNAQFASIEKAMRDKATQQLERMNKLKADNPTATAAADFLIQMPAAAHLAQMMGMAAGGSEDQSLRLNHMVQAVRAMHKETPSLPLTTSDKIVLAPEWINLFAAIDKGDKDKALALFKAIPTSNLLLIALLSVHATHYVESIITHCAEARGLCAATTIGLVEAGQDLNVTPKTFELLIYDIAATLQSPAKINFSFGLPSHHAFRAAGSGFCVFNKTAVLLSHVESRNPGKIKHVIVGTDVNRDNGLMGILNAIASHLDICHVDVFDSRVYPWQDYSYIDQEWGIKSPQAPQKIRWWQKKDQKFTYHAVDLSRVTRTANEIHPALQYALMKINESIEAAKKSGQKVMILLPTGWDSHQDETAECGKKITKNKKNKMIDAAEASKCRFNNADMHFFYETILKSYQANKGFIEGIYWGLEGGYSKPMYESQITLMLQVLIKQLLPQATPAPQTAAAPAPQTAAAPMAK